MSAFFRGAFGEGAAGFLEFLGARIVILALLGLMVRALCFSSLWGRHLAGFGDLDLGTLV